MIQIVTHRGAIGLALLLACASCGREASNRSDVFYYNESANLNSLDPAYARTLEPMWVVDQVFDGLVELDAKLQVKPLVAESYFSSDSGRVWTFVLREGVNFHAVPEIPSLRAGRPVVASDVVYSLNRLRDPAVASSGKWILDALDEAAPGAGIEAVGEDTVRFSLNQPFPPFLGLLATAYANIVPKEAVDHFGDEFRRNPIGCGPFKLAWWMEDVACVLHKNADHWERDEQGNALPYLEAVHISFVADMGAEFQGLLQGRYDFMSGLHPAYMEELLDQQGQLQADHVGTVRLESTPFLKTDYIGFYIGSADSMWLPWQDKAVRQALSLALDRSGIATVLRRGAVVPSNRFVPPALLNRSAQFVPVQDVARARRMLDSIQLAHPMPWPPLIVSTTSDYTDLCAAIQYQWQALGLDVEIDVVSAATHRDRVSNGKAAAFRKSWLADYADAENFLSLFRQTNFAPAGPNYTHFYDPNFELEMDQALGEADGDRRMALYQRMDDRIAESLPLVPLFHDQVTHFVRHEVEGWEINSINRLDLRRVRKRAQTESSN